MLIISLGTGEVQEWVFLEHTFYCHKNEVFAFLRPKLWALVGQLNDSTGTYLIQRVVLTYGAIEHRGWFSYKIEEMGITHQVFICLKTVCN